jgi:hypothetical protein
MGGLGVFVDCGFLSDPAEQAVKNIKKQASAARMVYFCRFID